MTIALDKSNETHDTDGNTTASVTLTSVAPGQWMLSVLLYMHSGHR